MTLERTNNLQDQIKVNYVAIDRLLLDNENPRFAGSLENASDKEVFIRLQREMALDELIDSFEKNGYYNAEPLLVVESEKFKNKFVVVEGNRRLAAIRTLLGSGKKLPESIDRQLRTEIPIAVYPNRRSLWTYLGFRHINGPQEWDSYSKAAYILRVHREYRIPIEKIAEQIGDRHATVVKMVNGLRLLEQAEERGFFNSEEVDLRRFHFSHLYTILAYENTRDFLGIKQKTKEALPDNPVSKSKYKDLELLLHFLFGAPDASRKPLIRSQNPDLRNLDSVLGSKRATRYLVDNPEDSLALENALMLTGLEDYKLEDLVSRALNAVRKIGGVINHYNGDDQVFRQMEDLSSLAGHLLAQMTAKREKNNSR